MHKLIFLTLLGAFADFVAVDGMLIGPRNSVIGRYEGILYQLHEYLINIITPIGIINMYLHLYSLPLKTHIPIKISLQLHLPLLHATTHHRVGARLSMIRNDILPEWLSDDERNGTGLREFWPFVMHEVGDEAVLYLGIVLCRFEASGNIIRKFYRKGIDVFTSGEVGVLKLVE